MPTITLNATTAQATRIQEAVDAHNAASGQALTVKQWIYLTLKREVAALLVSRQTATDQAQVVTDAQVLRNTVEADMSGGT